LPKPRGLWDVAPWGHKPFLSSSIGSGCWFFAWVTAEALRGGKGIIDKYIGDEMMIVFSREFGSEDPFVEAVQTARSMAENDVWSFAPHVGIASGRVVVGYVGTPLKYNCSVFGAPVALAGRCAGIEPATREPYSTALVFPATEWNGLDVDDVLPGLTATRCGNCSHKRRNP
jgi:hypothetical protein